MFRGGSVKMASSSTYSNPPCAACKFLRRKCLPGCIFAPYFPPEEPTKFINVHKVFGASNISKLLNEVRPHQREDAVNSLAYEAEARQKDPVYGCVGAISVLQKQVMHLQKELDATNADLMRYSKYHHQITKDGYPVASFVSYDTDQQRQNDNVQYHGRKVDYGGSSFDPNFAMPYPSSWDNGPCDEN